MNNFLERFKPQDDYSVEEVMKLLNDEVYLLEEAKAGLRIISSANLFFS